MNPVEIYLEELAAQRGSGAVTKETSGYGALANLLNSVGQHLKPKVAASFTRATLPRIP